jgi:hypothetical protein
MVNDLLSRDRPGARYYAAASTACGASAVWVPLTTCYASRRALRRSVFGQGRSLKRVLALVKGAPRQHSMLEEGPNISATSYSIAGTEGQTAAKGGRLLIHAIETPCLRCNLPTYPNRRAEHHVSGHDETLTRAGTDLDVRDREQALMEKTCCGSAGLDRGASSMRCSF